jgi:hypothetical protein
VVAVVVYGISAAAEAGCDTSVAAVDGTSVAGPQHRDIARGRFPVAIVRWQSAMHPAI